MVHSLVEFDEKDIAAVLEVLTSWCNIRGVALESAEGRLAVTAAVEIARNRGITILQREFSARIDPLL